jgi:hypothetical protein
LYYLCPVRGCKAQQIRHVVAQRLGFFVIHPKEIEIILIIVKENGSCLRFSATYKMSDCN